MNKLPSWLKPFYQTRPGIFVVITLITMSLGWLGEWQGWPQELVWGIYAIAYFTGMYDGILSSWAALRQRQIEIDLLMVLAALGALVVGQPFEGLMLLFLFSLSNVLQDYALGRTKSAIEALMKLRPDTAVVERNGELHTLPLEAIQIGEKVHLKPGERLPLDGRICQGQSNLDQSTLTGESLPVSKKEGDDVFAGTINLNGHLIIQVTKRASESTLARMIQLVEEAQEEKAKTQTFIERAEQYYAIGVIVATGLLILIPPALFGMAPDAAFYQAITVMVAASPCALVISVPATVLSAIGNGAQRGVLFKGGAAVEIAATTKVVALDKTGTLTVNKPQVTELVLLAEGMSEGELLALAGAVEQKSEHPLAQAIVQKAQGQGVVLPEIQGFDSTAGLGVTAVVDVMGEEARTVRIGNPRFFGQEVAGYDEAMVQAERLQRGGNTAVLVAANSPNQPEQYQFLGIIAIADVVRSNAAAMVQNLRQAGIEHVIMLTGDHHLVAQAIAQQVGIKTFYADLMPEDKLRLVKELTEKYGAVAMVGDGVNDAPALATAQLGIAMGAAGSDVALESADIVLMGDDLSHLPYIFNLSRKTRQTLAINLTFALSMIVLMIGGIFLFSLPLPLAVLGHEGGTVLVSLNGLRLLGYKDKTAPATPPSQEPTAKVSVAL
jgi:Zn2+/Cd2+-exporting ATPase